MLRNNISDGDEGEDVVKTYSKSLAYNPSSYRRYKSWKKQYERGRRANNDRRRKMGISSTDKEAASD
jgi:hypothetical protein